MVDVEPQGAAGDLSEQHLDVRLAGGELAFDLGLEALLGGMGHINKKRGRAPTFGTAAGPGPTRKLCDELSTTLMRLLTIPLQLRRESGAVRRVSCASV